MLELSELDFAPTLRFGGSKLPPLPPKPVKMGGTGDFAPKAMGAAVPVAAVSVAAPVAAGTSLASSELRAAIDALVAGMVAAGDVRFDRQLGEYVSTGVRWRFP